MGILGSAKLTSLERELRDEINRDVKSDTFGDAHYMRKGTELILAGLTAADKDGTAALERALADAAEKTANLKQGFVELEEAMDQAKRRTAENILQIGARSSHLKELVEEHLEHVASMLQRMEEENTKLQTPPNLHVISGRDNGQLPPGQERQNNV